jgi:allantoinase
VRFDLALTGGVVVTEHGAEPLEIGVRDGRIAALAGAGADPLAAAERIDCSGLHVLPGGVDPHVHFGDQGQSAFEDFETGTRAAASGGITTVLDMPLNLPPTVDAATWIARRDAVAPRAVVDFGLWGGLVPGSIGDLEPMARAGAVAFKAFLCDEVDWEAVSDADLYLGMQEAARLRRPVGVHCENGSIVAALRARLRGAGRTDLAAHAESRPEVAELEAIRRVVLLAGATGAAAQIVHISTGEGVDACRDARRAGADVGAEVTMHHLTLTAEDALDHGTLAKCAPPLRSRRQVEALWERVLAGEVGNVGSDHSPATFEQKDAAREHWDVPNGITGVQTLLPLLLSEGVHRRGLDLAAAARLAATGAARRFGLAPRKGAIRIGADADFAIVDLDAEWTLTADQLQYKAPWSPHEGTRIRGRVVRTVLRGTTVFADGEVVGAPGGGRCLAPSPAHATATLEPRP